MSPARSLPVHQVAQPGDKRTLCGLKGDTLPLGWVGSVQMHIDGRARRGLTFNICQGCKDVWMADHDGWPSYYRCAVCDLPILNDDRHTRDIDGADVHGHCCPDCPTRGDAA